MSSSCLRGSGGLRQYFQIAALERQVKELSTKTVQREQAEEAPVMNPGLGMLMITQGPG